jgi:hypothetical protein
MTSDDGGSRAETTEPIERVADGAGETRPGGATEPAPGAAMPNYRGEPLDADRGPGLGCFWIQIAILAVALVATPLSVVADMPTWVSAGLLIVTLVLLLFVGQTVIFLLRLVAADRRSRRRPLAPTARKTVGDLEAEDAPRDDDPGDETAGPRA